MYYGHLIYRLIFTPEENPMLSKRTLVVLISTGLMAGCAVGPDYERPEFYCLSASSARSPSMTALAAPVPS